MSADRGAIAAALEHANVPALLVTLIHLTGDLGLLDGPIRPRQVWGDSQMGLTERAAGRGAGARGAGDRGA